MNDHLLPLGDTGWSVWRDVLLRSTGFPADGLDLFAAGEAAAAADELLAGDGAPDTFDKAFSVALLDGSRAANAIAADPLLREALTWQNPGALVALDGLLRTDPQARGWRRRDRERILLRYWQRYCGKSETIGFFGPVCWGTIADPATPTRLVPGPGLVDRRTVHFEAWALMAYADRLGEDLRARRWWAPTPAPHLRVRGRRLHRPLQPGVELSPVDAWLLSHADGRTPAATLVDRLLAEPELGVRADADAYLLLDRLVEKDLLSWDAAVPNNPAAERVLRDRIAAIGDDPVRAAAGADLDRLGAARDAVAGAAGDPDRLGVAIAALNATFADLTGQAATRRSGEMYAGRTVIYEETTRDVELVVGGAVLDALAAPLAVVLRAARWLTAEVGAACGRVLTDLHADLAVDGPVPLSELWPLAQGLLFVAEPNPVASVGAEFTARWADLFGLAGVPAGQARLHLDSAALAGRVAEVFPADRPGWPSARLHSPDVQLCAASVEALNRGEFTPVLGELHPAYAPFDSAVFAPFHPDPAALRAALDTDLGPARVRVLYPQGWPRQTTRTTHGCNAPADRQIGIDTNRGGEAERLVPAGAVWVERVDGELRAVLPDGWSWPLVEVFANLFGSVLLDSFKLLAPAAHTPRITIDRLVVTRETWRTTVAATGLATVTGERDRFLAARRWRRDLGLPERVFVKIGTEVKPCYVDLGSPLHVQGFCHLLAAAARTGEQVGVTVSELLPGPRESWLTDAAGRGYVSELRLQITDPATYPTGSEFRPRITDPATHPTSGEHR